MGKAARRPKAAGSKPVVGWSHSCAPGPTADETSASRSAGHIKAWRHMRMAWPQQAAQQDGSSAGLKHTADNHTAASLPCDVKASIDGCTMCSSLWQACWFPGPVIRSAVGGCTRSTGGRSVAHQPAGFQLSVTCHETGGQAVDFSIFSYTNSSVAHWPSAMSTRTGRRRTWGKLGTLAGAHLPVKGHPHSSVVPSCTRTATQHCGPNVRAPGCYTLKPGKRHTGSCCLWQGGKAVLLLSA